MILCVTLNPCLDKTLTVPAWKPGDSVRGQEVREVVGGKGNNVARALKRLGGPDVRPVTFFGGATGEICELLLREEDKLDPIVIPTESDTRTILTVLTEPTHEQTAFFDPDPAITPGEAEALSLAVEKALREGGVEAITLSGSSPCPATHALYSDLIGLAISRRVPVFLDTYGPAMAAIWGFWPETIQMNRREAGIYLKTVNPSEQDILQMFDRFSRRGVRTIIVTEGPDPFLARISGRDYRVSPPEVEVVNPIGSGDCLLAGLVDAWFKGLDPESSLRNAVACAVANALSRDAGVIDLGRVEAIQGRVVVEKKG